MEGLCPLGKETESHESCSPLCKWQKNFEVDPYTTHPKIMVSNFVSSSFQLSEPSLWGLEALCALGLLQSDVTLATAVQEELFKHGGTNSHNAQVVFLDTILNIQKARYLVSYIIKF